MTLAERSGATELGHACIAAVRLALERPPERRVRFGREAEPQRCVTDHHEGARRVGEVRLGAQRAIVRKDGVQRRHLAHQRPQVGHVRGEIAAGGRRVGRGRVGRHAALPPTLERQPLDGRRRVRVAGRVEVGPDEARAPALEHDYRVAVDAEGRGRAASSPIGISVRRTNIIRGSRKPRDHHHREPAPPQSPRPSHTSPRASEMPARAPAGTRRKLPVRSGS